MHRALAFPVVALAGVLLQAGCSINAPHQGGAQSPGVTTGVGVSRSEITLSALTERAGPFSDIGTGMVHGEQMWINETNTAGGICGRKIKLAIRDDGATRVQRKPNTPSWSRRYWASCRSLVPPSPRP